MLGIEICEGGIILIAFGVVITCRATPWGMIGVIIGMISFGLGLCRISDEKHGRVKPREESPNKV